MTDNDPLARTHWRKSTFSGDGGTGGGNCVEVATLTDGSIAVRNSKHPEAGTLLFTRPEMAAWIQGCKTGQFDNLT